jgi:hypothetical protein
MSGADFAGTVRFCEVPDTDYYPIFAVSALENQVKYLLFAIFDISAKGISAHISNLDHTGQLTVYK